MRHCPACSNLLHPHDVGGVEIDLCARCGGVFLESGEAEAQGTDTSALFGLGPGAAEDLGPCERRCPVHRRAMKRYRVTSNSGSLEIERAPCCGGVFLDADEAAGFANAARRAAWLLGPPDHPQPTPEPVQKVPTTETVRGASGAQFAAPPPLGGAEEGGGSLGTLCRRMFAEQPVRWDAAPEAHPSALSANTSSTRSCPRCGGDYRVDRSGGVEVDVCPSCGSMFLDLGETDARGIDTSALFSVGPEAAAEAGPSELSCPACDQPMTAWRVTSIAGVIEVDRATCCGGLFLDGGEYDPFVRAARRARALEADRIFVRDGQVASEAAVMKAISGGIPAIGANFVRGRVDRMVQKMVRANRSRRRTRAGALVYFDEHD